MNRRTEAADEAMTPPRASMPTTDGLIFVLRHRMLILVLPFMLAVVVVGLGLTGRRSFTATVAFLPQADAGSLSRFAGIAAQLGVAVPTGEPGHSPQFYADLILSDPILLPVVSDSFEWAGSDGTIRGTLLDALKIPVGTLPRRQALGVRALKQRVVARPDVKTDLVTVTVRTFYPKLSAAVAQRILEQVVAFNLQSRRSRASAEREFIEGRLTVVGGELREAEDRLLAFLQHNREYRSSPQLGFEADRLQRVVTQQQALSTTLRQAYEQARIDEVRNTPALSVVQAPSPPALPDSRRLALKAILCVLAGGLLGAVIAVARDGLREAPVQERGREALVAQVQAAIEDLRHPLEGTRRAWRDR